MNNLVIDASVGLKWFLDDEREIKKAQRILDNFEKKQVKLLLPTLWIYEVTNGFRTAVLKRRIKKQDAQKYTQELKELAFPLVDLSYLVEKIMTDSLSFGLSIYDAAYVVLAKQEGVDFFTGDKRLYNTLKNKLSFVKWIGDYHWDT